MTNHAEGYVPVSVAPKLRRQAIWVWLVAAVVAFAWLTAILSAPIAVARGLESLSGPLYTFFGYICHQIADRSFHIEGEKFAVCSRCFGVYFGIFFGLVIYPLWRAIDEIEPLPRFWLFLSLVPIGVDWGLGIFGIWDNTHLSRFVTGSILGIACATFIMPAIVEITRNTFLDRQIRKAA